MNRLKTVKCNDNKNRRFRRAVYKSEPEESRCSHCGELLGYGSLDQQMIQWKKHKCNTTKFGKIR